MKDGSPQHWKDKYFKLLDDQEQFEKEQTLARDALCKTIVRLCIAVKGLNKALDPNLERLRELLKAHLATEELQQALEHFSSALMVMEEEVGAQKPADASLLFAFLTQTYPAHANAFSSVEAQYAHGQIAEQTTLFSILADIIGSLQADPEESCESQSSPDTQVVSQYILHLLDNLDLPAVFLGEVEQLKSRLLTEQLLSAVFDDATALLLAVKKYLQAEKQEMVDFLSALTEELTQLGLKASGVTSAHEDAQRKRDSLDREVAEQMAELQNKSASATQLEPLKQLVGIRLQSIRQQIQRHNLQEQIEKNKNQSELRALLQKLRTMEQETLELKSRLVVAQQRATLDPLTGLPNRLALEERLTEEIARAKRYGHALTIAVWDIDFFKNINDTYGHKSGDKALVIIARLLSKFCRKTDFVARFGGEEFVTLLPETKAQTGLAVVDKLRMIVERSGFKANGENVSITLSCGLTQYEAGDNNESLFVRADGALYQAKQKGRNQCVVV